ncbi:MAG: hypothetical protein R8N23_10600 [Reichenbachiella sp.]|uniref:hypothetical protein n=1 Tax=Reichenbachiella sp. TaxID=2184521 RepID=UPI002966DA44|nr:hypothetical protein [Reichenbachiella sp.]MDW3210308.1 hypothetical protein [Reichenbachiella sp.]
MNSFNFESNLELSDEYKTHPIFKQLDEYNSFYDSLSFSIMGFIKPGAVSIINLDSYVYSSIQGTLESINLTLKSGRINDAYALLRKLFDSTIINIYCNLYLEQEYTIETHAQNEINDWMKGNSRIPDYRVMTQYIYKSERLKPIMELLRNDDRYKKIRDRCNAHTHYNFFRYVLHNDNRIHLGNNIRENMLSVFSEDLKQIYIQHLSYLFFLNGHYMMSSDYMDHLEMGMTPPEGSEKWVSPPIQDVFNNVIKSSRPDIAEVIKRHTSMDLS